MLQLKFTGRSGNLPTSNFELELDGKKVGMLQIRHRPSRSKGLPPNMASHVYYEVEPEFRSRGLGTQILHMGIEEARKLGLTELILTCFEDNRASQKIIERNGGIFIEETVVPSIGKRMRKYRIPIK